MLGHDVTVTAYPSRLVIGSRRLRTAARHAAVAPGCNRHVDVSPRLAAIISFLFSGGTIMLGNVSHLTREPHFVHVSLATDLADFSSSLVRISRFTATIAALQMSAADPAWTTKAPLPQVQLTAGP
jgi:hypothetical protein